MRQLSPVPGFIPTTYSLSLHDVVASVDGAESAPLAIYTVPAAAAYAVEHGCEVRAYSLSGERAWAWFPDGYSVRF